MTHAGYFEGIGGFSLGAERAGIETIYACEIDEFKLNILKQHFPNAQQEKDITTATGMYADIFTAGFPCQDISRANPRGKQLDGSRSGLFFTFMAHVRRFRPAYVVLENSPMLVSKRGLLRILGEFASIGYDAEWQIISKHPFGYPDERERFIFVAYRSEIGRNESKPVFERKSFEKCIEAFKQRKLLFNQLSRKSSANDWTQFITHALQTDTGISKELAAKEIAAYGDAVCPDMAQLVFELIKIHHNGKDILI